jgi:GT2 family glycosyltransferase
VPTGDRTDRDARGHGDVLLVVPTLGRRPSWLRLAVRSITTQGLRARVLLVGPSDSGLEEVATDLSVELLLVDERGLSRAINSGVSDAEEEFVGWLGDDDLLAPGSLSRVTDGLSRQPQASFAYGRTRYIDEDGSTIGVTHPGRWAARYLTLGKDFVPQPGSLIRRTSWEAVGGLDESLANAMDLDLFIRLRRYGPSVYIPHEVSAYRLHAGSITLTKGSGDEGDIVRRRHLGQRALSTYAWWRPATRVIDRIVDASFRRLPARAPAGGARAYTSSDA